jgi:16S rRNA (guanine527-N7)-methyltransferase
VGSGAGLPGIPLALADPARRFTLLDSNGKKTAFLRHVLRGLGLKQVDVVQARAEDHARGAGRGRFDSVLSRAFASLAEMLEQAGPLCALQGKVLAMKGRFPEDELEELRHTASGFEVEGIVPLRVPGLAAERHLVIFSRG